MAKKKGTGLQMVAGKPMSNPTANKKKRKSRKGPRPQRSPAFQCSARDRAKLCDYLCARLDPLCDMACGARRTDAGVRSISRTFRVSTAFTQFTSGTGLGALQIRANLSGGYRKATGGAVNAWAAWQPLPGYSASNYSYYRITSMGAHCMSVVAPTSADGIVGAFTHMGDIPSTIDLTANLHSGTTRMPRYDAEFCVNFKTNGQEVEDYVDITAEAPGWSSATVFGHTMAHVNDQSILYVELIVNAELVPVEETDYIEMATPPPPRNDAVEQLVANAARSVPLVVQGSPTESSKLIKDTMWDQVAAFASVAGPYVLDAVLLAI